MGGITILALLLIWVNFRQLLYFTWDQGRDYFAIKNIVSGDHTLIGPTTGLHGFFLGPFWFYLGVPGYLLGRGSPLILSGWYVFMASLAIPVVYFFSKKLSQGNQIDHLLLYGLMALSPSSINGITKIWNPMIGITLMGLFFYVLLDLKKRPIWQILTAFFLLGLSLQAEFAYAVFFVPLGLLMVWKESHNEKGKRLLASLVGLGATLLPQILFELRNGLVMSKTLYNHIFHADDITWIALWLKRPIDLITSTKSLLVGNNVAFLDWGFFLILMLMFGVGVYSVLKNDKKDSFRRPIVYFALFPYFMYMFWKGNYGNFFDYYLTAHYLVIIPVFFWGIKTVIDWKISVSKDRNKFLVLMVCFLVCFPLLRIINYRVFDHENNAGYVKMNEAVAQIYSWIQEDAQNPGVVKIFTPNTNTEHYDALFLSQSREKNLPLPLTVASDDTTKWYSLIEPDHQLTNRLPRWRQKHTDQGVLVRSTNVGVLIVETWQKSEGSIQEN